MDNSRTEVKPYLHNKWLILIGGAKCISHATITSLSYDWLKVLCSALVGK